MSRRLRGWSLSRTRRQSSSEDDHSPIPFHPVLIALAIVLQFTLAASVDIRAAGRPLIVAPLGTALLVGLVWLLSGRRHLAGIVVDVVLLLLLVPGAMFVVIAMGRHVGPALWIPWLIAAVATVALFVRIALRLTRRWTGAVATAQLNRFSVFALAVIILSGVVTGGAAQAVRDLAPVPDPAPPSAATRRDVIVLLLDGYPRADTLQRLFAHDNGDFIDALHDLGFSVATRSRANYTRTELTLASMFHMRHLMDIPEYRRILAGELGEQPTLRNLINDNPAFDRFRDAGYEVISVAPGIERVTVRASNQLVEGPTINELEFHLVRSTAVGHIVTAIRPDWLAEQHRQRVLSALDAVENLATEETGGRFIFGHILSPHMPAVLREDGSLRPVRFSPYFFEERPESRGESAAEYVDAYLGQLEYLNRRVERMLNRIVEENPEAVVVVMSDHGSSLHFAWGEPDDDLDERFSILMAIRGPGASVAFEDGMTPVNLLTNIFNTYFGASLPMVRDSTYSGVIELEEVPNPDAPLSGVTRDP